ncbi:uncharacterized protein LOC116020298 [Ipomoea triloba]|uniref:uncharacterized protein LOC116020298 n=1 Tax=Ipomoea triloba TaxID=35885 RepID=UPI00125D6732|nr:uncharacterized protein LOC116020298 [Ipomoea triloba]
MYVDNEANEDDESEDQLDEMFRDVGEEFTDRSNELDELLNDSKLPLWPGCSKYTRLSVILKLFNLKAGNGWSDKSFTTLLEILKDMLLDDNELPKSTYDAKKILCPMGMGYKKIHVCPNDCILFRDDYKDLHACPICGASLFKTRENVAGKLQHPANSCQWTTFDNAFPEFGQEPRNLRLGLCTDGNDIDVFLAHLIEDLKSLWDEAYGNLSGYSVKGHKACPICEDNTYAPQPLTGIQVYERVECINVTFGKTQKLKSQRGKRSKSNVDVPSNVKSPWKKKSIFFDLPYWKTLDVRHSIGVMHVEKNMCDSLVGTLLDIKGKTKDGLNARLDLIEMGIRLTLAPRNGDKKTYLPPAAHTLSRKERISFCECLRGVKVPQWDSSNISRLVNIQDLKLVGLKSHDCHALMQQLLPVAVRGILPKKLRYTVIRLCFFSNAICAKVIDLDKLDELQNGIIVTLALLSIR